VQPAVLQLLSALTSSQYAGKKVPLRIKLPGLTLAEVEAAVMQPKSDKTPGIDEITFRVWKELWPVLGSVVLKL
jgi:hypothetical protein